MAKVLPKATHSCSLESTVCTGLAFVLPSSPPFLLSQQPMSAEAACPFCFLLGGFFVPYKMTELPPPQPPSSLMLWSAVMTMISQMEWLGWWCVGVKWMLIQWEGLKPGGRGFQLPQCLQSPWGRRSIAFTVAWEIRVKCYRKILTVRLSLSH